MQIKVGEFEGAYELLFHLIEKNKIDIKDIPIAFIADQFIEYVETHKTKDMNELSEFVIMTATLLFIKTKMLLPVKEVNELGEEIDPREELVERLIEYKRAKQFAIFLKEQKVIETYSKEPEKQVIKQVSKNYDNRIETLLNEVSISQLSDIFNTVILKMDNRVDKIRKDFNSIKKDEFTVENRVKYILDRLQGNNKLSFLSLFEINSSKSEKVTTFLAVLELIKVNKIKIMQESLFEDIIIRGV